MADHECRSDAQRESSRPSSKARPQSEHSGEKYLSAKAEKQLKSFRTCRIPPWVSTQSIWPQAGGRGCDGRVRAGACRPARGGHPRSGRGAGGASPRMGRSTHGRPVWVRNVSLPPFPSDLFLDPLLDPFNDFFRMPSLWATLRTD
jgi:hypothetical protein